MDDPLATWVRWVMATIGTVLTVAGSIAVFVPSTNVAGVPLLIVAGAGFLYAALAGQPLLQLNKDGLTFARVRRLRRAAQAVAADPAVPDDIRERIVDVFEDNGVSIASPRTERDLEAEASAVFVSLAREHGFQVLDGRERGDAGADMVLVNRDGQTVGIEVRSQLTTRGLAAAIRGLRRVEAGHRILVVDRPLPREIVEAFQPEGLSVLAVGPTFREDVLALLRRVQFVST